MYSVSHTNVPINRYPLLGILNGVCGFFSSMKYLKNAFANSHETHYLCMMVQVRYVFIIIGPHISLVVHLITYNTLSVGDSMG